MQALILLTFLVGSSAQVSSPGTGGEQFVSINGASPTLEYDGFDASLSPELATGVMWTEGTGPNADYGPIEAYPISAAELALRDDISKIFVDETPAGGDESSSFGSFATEAGDITSDPVWSAGGGGSYDAQGAFQIFESMYCDPMDAGELVPEGGEDLEECKSLCLRDTNCAAVTYYPVDITGLAPYTGCYQFSSCDENSRRPNAFGSTLLVKQDSAAAMSQTLTSLCDENTPNDCDLSSTDCVIVAGGSGPSCECLPGFTPSSSPLSCDLITMTDGVVATLAMELAAIDTNVNTMGSHTSAVAAVVGVVAGVALVVAAVVVHLRSKAAAQPATTCPTANSEHPLV